jgi:hypothetical protein
MINATGFLPRLEFGVKDVITAIAKAKSAIYLVSSSLVIRNPGFSDHFTKHVIIRIKTLSKHLLYNMAPSTLKVTI